MLEKQLFKKYSKQAYLSGSETYFSFDIAKKFLLECTQNNLAILGVDFVHKEDEKIIPCHPINSIDCSDFLEETSSWEQIVESTAKFTQEILLKEEEMDARQLCCFILLSEEEFRKKDY